MDKGTDTHCQICGRLIQAKNGRVAHHGYTRPGDGWQTPSCMGAKYRPYEVACDALPKAIAAVTQHIAGVEAALTNWIANPPRGIEASNRRRSSFQAYTLRHWTAIRPAGFDPANISPYTGNEYTMLFRSERGRLEQDIRGSQQTLAYLTQRLADWRAPG